MAIRGDLVVTNISGNCWIIGLKDEKEEIWCQRLYYKKQQRHNEITPGETLECNKTVQ